MHAKPWGGLSVAVLLIAAVLCTPQAAAAAPDPLPAGKAEGSGEYGLIGDSQETLPSIYGVALDADGSIWYAIPDGAERGIVEYRPGTFDPTGGDYLGDGDYADGTGYLGSAWEAPIRYAHRESTAADPAGGSQVWAEPRGIEPLPGGGIAVSDTNGNTSAPVGTILMYDAAHTTILGNAGVGGDQGCTQLAQGELAWGPYFGFVGDELYAPYEGCNVVSVFSVPDGAPLYRLTGAGQTAGASPNPPGTDGPGSLDEIYGVSSDGTQIYTSDLGFTRTPATGMVQRWDVDPDTDSWALDTSFGTDGALSFPGQMIYETVIGTDGELFVIPQTGAIQRFDHEGNFLAEVQVRDVPYSQARDLAVTPEGWLVMTAKGDHSLRILAESPDPVTGLTGASGAAAGSVTLSWDEVGYGTGQVPVLDYVIEQSADGGMTWDTVSREISTATSATIAGLAPGEYSFRVAAYSEAGRGDIAQIDAVVATAPAPGIDTSLAGTAPPQGAVDAPIAWEATLSNPGNTPLAEVTARFDHGAGNASETVAVADLPVGGNATARVATAMTRAELAALRASNAVTVSGTAPDGTRVTAEAAVTLELRAPEPVTDPGSDPGSDPGADPGAGPGTPTVAQPAPAGTDRLARTGGAAPTGVLVAAAALIAAALAALGTGRFAQRRRASRP